MHDHEDNEPDYWPPPPGFRMLSILIVTFGAMVSVIIGSLTALVGRSSFGRNSDPEGALTETLWWLNLGGPLIMILGWAVRRLSESRFRQVVAAACLVGLGVYLDFAIGVFRDPEP